MAISDAYATNTTYKAIIGKTSGDNDSEIDAQLLAMSRVLERDAFGGRYFTKDAAVTTRRYYPTVPYQKTLHVEDIATATGLIVKVDDNRDGTPEATLTITTDFELMPLNAPTGPEPDPYTGLFLPPRSPRYAWIELVEVTAVHGYPAIPRAIVEATCQLVALLRLEGPRATSQITEGLSSVLGIAPAAQTMVDRLISAYAKPAWIWK